jgi:hypothetical protein
MAKANTDIWVAVGNDGWTVYVGEYGFELVTGIPSLEVADRLAKKIKETVETELAAIAEAEGR